jgi:hypothetical protein
VYWVELLVVVPLLALYLIVNFFALHTAYNVTVVPLVPKLAVPVWPFVYVAEVAVLVFDQPRKI